LLYLAGGIVILGVFVAYAYALRRVMLVRVLTHRQLLTAVWGPANAADVQYLRVFIGRLRHRLEADPASPKRITTESGVGYRFISE
jgi:two-component system KDP operon response regulator KdpE